MSTIPPNPPPIHPLTPVILIPLHTHNDSLCMLWMCVGDAGTIVIRRSWGALVQLHHTQHLYTPGCKPGEGVTGVKASHCSVVSLT